MRIRSFAFAIFSMLGLLHAAPSAASPVQYVRICDLYGPYYYYSPGSDSCVNSITGEVRTQTEFGLMRRQTYVVARVRAMESDFCDECFAVVGPGGGAAQSDKLTSSTRLGPGKYQVVFEKPINKCAINATLGSFDNSGEQPAAGMITVGRTTNADNKGLIVWTYTAWGALQDRAFHVSLECEHKKPFCTVTKGSDTHVCTAAELAGVKSLGPDGP